MLQKIQKRKDSGFTIIEVLIVLAIAGLIMLIVFLAVPALQRNSRNTQYKSAASSILGAVTEFSNNNNGQLPTLVQITNGDVSVTGVAGSAPASAKVQSGFTASVTNTMPGAGVTGVYAVGINRKCNGSSISGANSPRALSIGFQIETTSSATAPQCVES